MPKIIKTMVKDNDRINFLPRHFGLITGIKVESYIYDVAHQSLAGYNGGYWSFFELSNGSFIIEPSYTGEREVTFALNWFSEKMNAEDYGIVVTALAIQRAAGMATGRRTTDYGDIMEKLLDYARSLPDNRYAKIRAALD